MYNKKIIARVMVVITIIVAFGVYFVEDRSELENRVNNKELHKEIESPVSDFEIMNKIGAPEKSRIYDGIDDFPYQSMEFVDKVTFEMLKNIYENISFYGEFEKGNEGLYDYYKEKFLLLLNCTVKFKCNKDGEEYYITEYGRLKPQLYYDEFLDLRGFDYYFFDADGDDTPELCICASGSTYIFKYISQTDDFVLWYELDPSNYQLNGTKKIRWDGLNSGLDQVFYELDKEGNEECIVYFFLKPIYNNKTNQTDIVGMVALPQYSAYSENIMIKLTNQAYFANSHKTYYYRVTEEQYDILTEGYYKARLLASENIKDVTFTYNELFGDF